MVLFSFSIPKHIQLIQSGQKAQTTRQPRKPRKNGAKPYSVGERVQLYCRSRQKPSCHNCILIDAPDCRQHQGFDNYCKYHANFFGESVITEIQHHWNLSIGEQMRMYEDTHTALLGNEKWLGLPLGMLDDDERDSWAQLDGFPNGFKQAHEFFYGETGDSNWMFKNLDVIHWDGTQIARRVA